MARLLRYAQGTGSVRSPSQGEGRRACWRRKAEERKLQKEEDGPFLSNLGHDGDSALTVGLCSDSYGLNESLIRSSCTLVLCCSPLQGTSRVKDILLLLLLHDPSRAQDWWDTLFSIEELWGTHMKQARDEYKLGWPNSTWKFIMGEQQRIFCG